MAKEKATKKTIKPKDKTEKLIPRIHFNEFIQTCDMASIEVAGFRAFIGETVWRRPEEWVSCLKKYNTRNK